MPTQNNAKNIIGKKLRMNCGLVAKITAYRNCGDIDVALDNGVMVYHTTFGKFLNRSISGDRQEDHLGEKSYMSCGMNAQIIVYRGLNDIDVQFGNGAVAMHQKYDAFLKGNIKDPNVYCADIMPGEILVNKEGLKFKVVRVDKNDNRKNSWDVKFEDGIDVDKVTFTRKSYKNVKHPMFSKNALKKDGFYGYKVNGLAFKTVVAVYYFCSSPSGDKDVLTPQEIIRKAGIKPAF